MSTLVLLAATSLAEAAAPLASIRSTDKAGGVVQIIVEDKLLVLRPLSDGAIRVQFSDASLAGKPDFVLLTNQPVPRFTVREDKNSITVAAAKVRAVVDRATGAVRFHNGAREVFLAEKPGTRALKPVAVRGESVFEVGQEFKLADGEKLIGLGQFQDGLWDWRGLPIELRQLNTQIAVPMLVFSPKGRDIRWQHLNQGFFSIGVDAWWGDATEPGDPGTDSLGKKLSIGPGDEFTSAYPLFASESLYDGQRATDPNKRAVTLQRSAFPGQQRYAAAAWSGDINGDWETFKRQIPAGLNFCLTGLPYWTTDCGGFFHPRGQYTSGDFNELLTRWFEWSTFCPILRIHGYQTETEMWKWLPTTQTNLIAYDQLRYRMLPYNYSVAWKITSESYTPMRALMMDVPNDKNILPIANEYMFGPAFLVCPVTTPQAVSREVYLPSGTGWVDFWTGKTLAGGKAISANAPVNIMPLFVRAGSIVPLGPVLQYAIEKPADPIELRVYRGADGKFTLYEDEGDNYNYEKGKHATIPFEWNESKQTLATGRRSGDFKGMLKERTFHVAFVSPNHGAGAASEAKPDAVIHYTGKLITVSSKQ